MILPKTVYTDPMTGVTCGPTMESSLVNLVGGIYLITPKDYTDAFNKGIAGSTISGQPGPKEDYSHLYTPEQLIALIMKATGVTIQNIEEEIRKSNGKED